MVKKEYWMSTPNGQPLNVKLTDEQVIKYRDKGYIITEYVKGVRR